MMILLYNSQVNKIIKIRYRPIIDTLLKMIQREITIEINNWVMYFSIILLADRIIVKANMKMTSF